MTTVVKIRKVLSANSVAEKMFPYVHPELTMARPMPTPESGGFSIGGDLSFTATGSSPTK